MQTPARGFLVHQSNELAPPVLLLSSFISSNGRKPRWLALLHKPPGQDLGEDLNELACMHDFFVNILDVLTNVDAFYRNIFNILPILPVIC